MRLNRVDISQLRNLSKVSLQLTPGLNIVEGDNGSGKTSLLEALFFLGLGKSFRTHRPSQLIQNGQSQFTLFAELGGQSHHRLGVQWGDSAGLEIRIDGKTPDSRAQLANLLPLQLMTPDSISLLLGHPVERREYLDWLLFHVEHQFHPLWMTYQRNLKQRNALLRQEQIATIDQWTDALCQTGERLNQMRQSLVKELLPIVRRYLETLLPEVDLVLQYRQGWKRDLSLSDSMEKNLDTDRKMKHTTTGPHRADLIFLDGDSRVTEIFSRGQLKLLLAALKLSQMSLVREKTGRSPVVLIDDLPAELDSRHRDLFLTQLRELETQVVVTTTDRRLLNYVDWSGIKLFHVEHGVIEEVV